MAGIEVCVTLALLVTTLARLAWVEASASDSPHRRVRRHAYRGWRRRHVLDVALLTLAALFIAVVAYRFLTMG